MNGFSTLLDFTGNFLERTRDPTFAGIAGYLLALVFLFSSVAKLRQPGLAATAIANFGFGRRPYPILGLLLGIAELALALLLMVSVRVAPWLAAFVLWLFALLIARSLLAGSHFACFCFGNDDSAMSWRTFVQTALLAVLASLLSQTSDQSAAALGPGDRLDQAMIAAALLAVLVLGTRAIDLLQWSRASLHALKDVPT
jgi:hypothetical protein